MPHRVCLEDERAQSTEAVCGGLTFMRRVDARLVGLGVGLGLELGLGLGLGLALALGLALG